MSDELVISETPTKSPVCECLARLRAHLLHQDENGFPALGQNTGAAVIFIRRCNPAGQFPPMVLASYCPFCGTAYE